MWTPGGQIDHSRCGIVYGGGKGGGGSAPAAPDPVATAQAQTASNVDTARKQAELNRINQYTPQGQITWSTRAPDLWDVTTTLSPEQQRIYDLTTQGQQLYGQTAVNQLGAVANQLSTPMTGAPYLGDTQAAANYAKYGLDWAADPRNGTWIDPSTGLMQTGAGGAQQAVQLAGSAASQPINTDYNAVRQQAINAANSRLDPQFARDEEQMRSRLLAAGVPEGSSAWNNAYMTFNQAKNDARQQTLLNAENLAGQAIQQTGTLRGIPIAEAQALSNIGGQAANVAGTQQAQALQNYWVPYQRAQQLGNLGANYANIAGAGIQQTQAVRNQPLNETAALLTGQMMQTPQMVSIPQVGVAPTDVIGATMGSYQGQLNAYNAQQQANAAALGGLYGLGGSALMGAGLLF